MKIPPKPLCERSSDVLLGKRVQAIAMRSDGSEFPVELTVTPVQLQDHIIFTAYLRGVTKEKCVEQELRRYAVVPARGRHRPIVRPDRAGRHTSRFLGTSTSSGISRCRTPRRSQRAVNL